MKPIKVFDWESSNGGCISGKIPDEILVFLEKDEEWVNFQKDLTERKDVFMGG